MTVRNAQLERFISGVSLTDDDEGGVEVLRGDDLVPDMYRFGG